MAIPWDPMPLFVPIRVRKQALVLEPENGAYLDSLGWFYYKKGKFKEALSHLERAASFLTDPVIYDHLGFFQIFSFCDFA